MSERKRATKGQFKKLAAHSRSYSNELKQYLSIIDDLYGKLLNPAKYPGISNTDKEKVLTIAAIHDYDDFEKSKLWPIAENPNWPDLLPEGKLQDLKEQVINIYQSWVTWTQYSVYADSYPELVASLRPATQKLLPRIVPSYQSPDQIRAFQYLEAAFNPEEHSNYGITDFAEFREAEPGQYQKLAKERYNHYQYLANIIQKHAPITKEPIWPNGWMQDHKGIIQNLEKKKLFIPILQYLTDHAFNRTDESTKSFGLYRHEKGKEYKYLVVKATTGEIADDIGASKDTVKKIIGA